MCRSCVRLGRGHSKIRPCPVFELPRGFWWAPLGKRMLDYADFPPPLARSSFMPTLEVSQSCQFAHRCANWQNSSHTSEPRARLGAPFPQCAPSSWFTCLLEDILVNALMLLVSVTTMAEGNREVWEYWGGSCLCAYTAEKQQQQHSCSIA